MTMLMIIYAHVYLNNLLHCYYSCEVTVSKPEQASEW
jgi:hypothetical protein